MRSKNWISAVLVGGVLLQAGLAAAQGLPAVPKSPAAVVKHEYDAEGNVTRTVVAPGVAGFDLATGHTYDALQRRVLSTDAKSGVTSLQYNGQDRLTRVIDPRTLVTTTPRNGLGDVAQVVSPDTGTASQSYDAAGNLTRRVDSRGVIATPVYDALNRLTQVVYTQTGKPSEAMGWAHDQTGAGFAYGVGRLTTATHPAGSSTYQYDAQGRLTVESQSLNAQAGANAVVTKVASYGYDAAGHLTSITYPSNRRVDFTYTGGVLSAIGLASVPRGVASALLTNVQWEPFGAARSWQWVLAGGALQPHERVFDPSGRLVRYRLGPVVRDLSYDAGDRIKAFDHYDATTGAPLPGLRQGFDHDPLGQLTQVSANATTWSFSYDANGNRTGVLINGVAQGYAVDPASNRLKGLSNPASTLTPDAMGNTLADSGKGYTATFNLAGRMSTLTRAGITTSYTYDGQGRRLRKASSAGTVIFVHDPAGHLLGEYDGTGAALREYVWMGDTPMAMFTPGTTATAAPLVYYLHSDHLDTPRVAVDTSGRLRWRWMAEPFGSTAPETNPAGLGSFTQNLRFPGQYADAESGLFYNGFRDYDPATGRYTQSDPIGLAGGINTYAYVSGNPLRYADPAGLCPMCLVLPFVGGGVTLADIGVGIGIGGSLIGLDKMFNKPRKTPNSGEPDSCHVNPGSGQERKYGKDSKPEYDIDWDHDHGQGSPHGHNWDGGKRDHGWPISSWPRGRAPWRNP
jgi:RHS repeat-associated protein